MWFLFFASVLLILFLLYSPGYLFFRSFFHERISSFALAPSYSIFAYVLFGVLFHQAGLFCQWWMLVVSAFLVSAAVLLIARFSKGKQQADQPERVKTDWRIPLAYIAVSVFVVLFLFVGNLGSPAAFAQLYDNAAHLNIIQSMVENGNYSTLSSSLYSDDEVSFGVSPVMSYGSFYPSGWHLVSALGLAALGGNAAIAENASLVVFLAVVFPVSLSFCMGKLISETRIVLCGSLLTLGFTAFPWGFMTFGPLYSNLAAFCVLPLAICSICSVFSLTGKKKERLGWAATFLLTCVSLAVLQPNSIFAVVPLAAPFCVVSFWKLLSRRKENRIIVALLGCGSLVALLLIFWLVAWKSPLFQGVVAYPWPQYEGKVQAAFDVASFSLRSFPPQWALSALVLLGMLWTMTKRKYRSLSFSFLICSFMFVVCASTDGSFRSLIDGFWYNDAYRIAALVALSAIPLASIGLYVVAGFVLRFTRKIKLGKRTQLASTMAILLLCAAFIYAPLNLLSNEDGDESAFEVLDGKLRWLSAELRYTNDESAFVENAVGCVKDDPGGIANVPYDGSVFSYGADGADVMFRSYSVAGSNDEKPQSVLVRQRLNEIATDSFIAEAARDLNIKYVLQLDCFGIGAESSSLDDGLAEYDKYKGIASVDEDTPGFELVASEGDMRLYKVVA